MSIMSALNNAVSGLRATQAGIDVVSQNVANAGSVGYSKRRLDNVQLITGDSTGGVKSGQIQRILDQVAQKQLRLETSGASYTSLKADFARGLDQLFGTPGGAGSLDGEMNAFTQSLQSLVNEPGSNAARGSVVNAGRVLAANIANVANGVQSLRTQAEGRLSNAITRANDLLSGIASINAQIVSANQSGGSPALHDERDRMVDDLSSLMDVQISEDRNGSIHLMTTGGLQLFDGTYATRLTFDDRSPLNPNSAYSPDNAQRGVGTIKATLGNGAPIDVISTNMIRSGEIAGALELRDKTLMEAQRQLDELAGGLSRALSDTQRPSVPSANGAASGFEVDLTGLQSGNDITIDYRAGGVAKRIIVIPTNGPLSTPINPSDTNDSNATIISIDISSGLTNFSADLQTQLTAKGINLQADSPSTNVLRVLDDGATSTTDVSSMSASVTSTTLSSGNVALPFFVDSGRGNQPFTGSFDGGAQITGFAQRINVNPSLQADRSKLVVYNTSPQTSQGDATRPQKLLDSLTNASRAFAGASNVNGINAPFSATPADFAKRIVETQGANIETIQRFDEGQQVALKAVQSRFSASTAVKIDEEMSQLVTLQSAYSANARVITAAKDMLDLLMRV